MGDFVHIETGGVLRLLGYDISKQHSDNIMIDCPICRSKRKLSVKLSTGQLKCWSSSCGYTGNIITLYGSVNNITNKEAYESILRELNLDSLDDSELRRRAEDRKKEIKKKDKSTAAKLPVEECDKTYRALIDKLKLSNEHHLDLIGRGFDEGTIQAGMYRSIGNENLTSVTFKILEEGYHVEGVPGFFKNWDGKWTFRKMQPGYLVPYRNENNKIQALQIRVDESARTMQDNNKLSPKYLWISTDGFDKGCGCQSPAHWACDFVWDGEKFVPLLSDKRWIGLTEGALKGDAFYSITGTPMICVAGVTCYNSAKEALQKAWGFGFRKLFLFFDMDSETNEDVACALSKMSDIAKQIGFDVCRATWNRLFKGIDDYYNAKKQGKASFESVAYKGKCAVCGKELLVANCKSRTGNEIFAYCSDCFDAEYEPLSAIKDYVAKRIKRTGGKYPDCIPELQLCVIKKSLKYYNISEETFLNSLQI